MWEVGAEYNESDDDSEALLELGDSSSIEDQDHLNDNIAVTDAEGVKLNRYGVPIGQGLLGRPRAQRRASVGGKWTVEEDSQLKDIVQVHGAKSWKKVASLLGKTRTDVQCLHRWNKVLRPGLQKGSWSKEEDAVVRAMVAELGVAKVKWSTIAEQLPGRIGKQCRERWFNHLDPSIKKGDWARDEEIIIYEAQRHFGNRWCEISKLLPGRTENAVKNRWNSCTMKRWLKEKLQLEAESGISVASSLTAAPVVPVGETSTRKRGKAAASASSSGGAQQERERMLQSLEGFRRSLAAAGVSLGADAAAALEGIMIGESDTSAALAKAGSSSALGGGGGSAWREDLPTPYPNLGGSTRASRAHAANSASHAAATISHDECAHQLVEMLHLLKKTAPPGVTGPAGSSASSASSFSDESKEHSDASEGSAYSGGNNNNRRKSKLRERGWGHDDDDDELVDFQPAPSNSNGNVVSAESMLASHLQRVEQLRKRKRGNQTEDKADSSASAGAAVGGRRTSAAPASFPFSFGLMEPAAMREEALNDVQVPLSLLAASARVAAGAAVASGGISPASANVLKAFTSDSNGAPSLMPPYDPTCPVSVAMSKLKSLMDHADPSAAAAAAEEEEAAALSAATAAESESSGKASAEEAEENEVPLECLRFFKLLNRASQRSLMRQLISQLQRTACTPRDSLMGLGENTPRYLDANLSLSLGLMRDILPGYEEQEQSEFNENCFEMAEMDDHQHSNTAPPSSSSSSAGNNSGSTATSTSGAGMSGSNLGGIVRPGALTMPPPTAFPAATATAHKSPLFRHFTPRFGLARPLRPSKLSAEDEAAVEAAVEIGFLLSQYSQTDADLLLQTLHKEGNLNIFGSSNTPRIGSIGR